MSDSVAKRSPEAEALYEAAKVGRALMGGTKAMRAVGKEYLPQFEAESDLAYKARLNSSFLFNGFKDTVKDLCGRVFAKPVEVQTGTLDADIEANVDGQHRDLSTFAMEVFKDGLSGSGISFIMVDAPRVTDGMTRAQAQAANLRPYLVHVTVDEVLGWKTVQIGSKTVLSQLRVMEVVKEEDPSDEFNTVSIEQVRVLTLDGTVSHRIYRQREKAQGAKWYLHDEYQTDAKEITVVPFYAARTGFMMAEPPLQDLADKNVEHWQSASDQRNILHFARVPILFASGYDDEDGKAPLTISAGTATTSRDPNASLQWVEHSGQAIAAGRDDLKDLEVQMQALGLQLLVEKQETATGAALDAAKETAPLAMMADSLKDAIEQALAWVAMYQGRDQVFSVAVNKDFGVAPMTAADVTAILSAVNTGNMSRETALKEMARRGFIAPDIDVQDEIERIEADSDRLMTAPQGNDGFSQ